MGIIGTSAALWPFRDARVTAVVFLAVDVALLGASAILSFIIRLDTLHIQEFFLVPMVIFVVAVVLLRPLLLNLFGLYGQGWRYAGPRELLLIVAAMTLGSIILALFVLALLMPLGIILQFPRSVLLIEWMLSIFAVGGVRFTRRLLEEGRSWRQRQAATELLKQSAFDDDVDYLASLRSLYQRIAAGDLRAYGAAYDPGTDSQATYGDDSWLDALSVSVGLAQGFYRVGQYETALRAFTVLLDILLLIRAKPGLAYLPAGCSVDVDVAALERGFYSSLRRLYPTGEFSERALEAWQRFRPLQVAGEPMADAFSGDRGTLKGLQRAVESAMSQRQADPARKALLEGLNLSFGKAGAQS